MNSKLAGLAQTFNCSQLAAQYILDSPLARLAQEIWAAAATQTQVHDGPATSPHN